MDWFFIGMVLILIFSLMALVMAIIALVFVLALKNSTHRIEWRPIDNSNFQSAEEMNKLIKEREEMIEEDFV